MMFKSWKFWPAFAWYAITLCAMLLFGSLECSSQQQSNAWIDYSKPYLAIKVYKNSIHELDYPVLQSEFGKIGIGIDDIDPRTLQLFARGKEVPMFIKGEGDGIFDSVDIIEFVGFKNDGWLDSLLYENPQDQANPHYSLFNDTALYYLTIGQTLNNLRFATFSNINISSGQRLDYVWNTSIYQNPEEYLQGKIDGFGKNESYYLPGKGWFDRVYTYLDKRSRFVQTPRVMASSSAPKTELKIKMASASNASQNPDHGLKILFSEQNIQLVDTTFDGYHLLSFEWQVQPDLLTLDSTRFTFSSEPLPTAPASDRMAIGFIELKYPMSTVLGLDDYNSFQCPQHEGNGFLRFENVAGGTEYESVFDLTNNRKILPLSSGNRIEFVLPDNKASDLILQTKSSYSRVSPSGIFAVSESGYFTNYLKNEIDSAFIILTQTKLLSAAHEYADYRDQEGAQSLVVDVEELYHQYAYGIQKHPLAIRYFAQDLLDQWSGKDHLLFIIGKGISDHKCRLDNDNFHTNLVPSFGWPTADNGLTSGLNGTISEPAIGTGRLAAHSTEQVDDYLLKVKQFESYSTNNCLDQNIENRLWLKHVLHFGGGTNSFEQGTFRSYLDSYKATISGEQYGGRVFSFFKSSADPIQSNLSDSITTLINEGVSLITFFGHSSGGTFDISVDHPSTYQNYSKYPLFLANGCFSGDIHGENSVSQSEQFVMIPNKGSIGFLASVHLGFANHLNTYSKNFYQVLSEDFYGQSLGRQMIETARRVQTSNKLALINTTALEMTLHGDPSLILNAQPKADYTVRDQDIFFTPEKVTTELDSFAVQVVLSNLGKTIQQNASLTITRTFPDNSEQKITKVINPVFYKDTIISMFNVDLDRGIGLNSFSVAIDETGLLEEICEFNNTAESQVWITADDLIPVYPYKYAVVPDPPSYLVASSANPLKKKTVYSIEIDTTSFFNSPRLFRSSAEVDGGIVRFEVDSSYYLPQDSVVYFWRTRPENELDGGAWKASSFQIIDQETGWGQSHFHQFLDDEFHFVQPVVADRRMEFSQNVTSLRATVYGNPSFGDDLIEFFKTQYSLNGAQQAFGICGAVETIIVAVIDSLTHEPWGTRQQSGATVLNPEHAFGNANDLGSTSSANCRGVVEKYFLFEINDPVQMDSLASMLTNRVPEGSYILAYTGMRGKFQDPLVWEDAHYKAFEDLGAQEIRGIPNSNPYIFFCQKGKMSSAVEIVGEHTKDVLTLDVALFNNLANGSITSTSIGPAERWKSVKWRFNENGLHSQDVASIQISEMTDNTLYQVWAGDALIQGNHSLEQYSGLNSQGALSLQVKLGDDSLQTPPQLERWHVLLDEIPDVAVSPNMGAFITNDTVSRGQEIGFAIPVVNVSTTSLVNFRVKYWIQDEKRNILNQVTLWYDSLGPGDSIKDTVKMQTTNISGSASIWMEVNPKDTLWIPEREHFNNILKYEIEILRDRVNPLLEVTFDGLHILDGDIVSSNPEILISLNDENQFLILDDTSNFKLFLTNPDGVETRVWFHGQTESGIVFEPGTTSNNTAKILLTPGPLATGIYKLRVQANDVSRNSSGFDYIISFEVDTEPSITNLLNYPNPFTTNTRFVFTLTGSELPTRLDVEIFTITGRLIRRLDLLQDPDLRIGRNITSISWDGNDRYGDPVGNGVYLYRVNVDQGDGDIAQRESGADQFIEQGFGKMYLMR